MMTHLSGRLSLLISLLCCAVLGPLWAGPGYVQLLDPIVGTTNSGTVSIAGQEDRFVFTGTAGQRLYYDTFELDGQGLQFRVVWPSGLVAFGGPIAQQTEPVPFYLTENGSHEFVMDGAGDATGNHRFRLLNVDSEPSVIAGPTNTVSLAPASRTVIRRFAGTAGQRIMLERVSASTNNAEWMLYGPANEAVASTGVDYDLGTNLLRVTGTYLLVVKGTVEDDTPLDFAFRILDVSDAPVGATGFGTVHSGTVAADTTNSFTFTASAGTVAYYDSLQTYNGVTAQLLDPDGNILHQGEASYNGGPVLLPRSGTYTVNIIGSAAGDYSFRLLNCSAASLLTMGVTSTGVFNLPYGAAFWRFAGQPGQRLLYDATEPDLEQTSLTVFNPRLAGVVGQSAEGDSAPFGLTEPGTHYVMVESGTSDPAADGVLYLPTQTKLTALTLTPAKGNAQ